MAATTTFAGPAAFSPDANNPAASWADYEKKFRNYAVATRLTDAPHAVQVATFLHFVGNEAHILYETFDIIIPQAGELTLELIFDAFTAHYAPYKNLIATQFDLLTTKQLSQQPFDEFLTVIKTKARRCELGTAHNSILCTLIAMGVASDDLRKRIIAKRDLTLDQVVAMCQADEASALHAKTIAPEKTLSSAPNVTDIALDALSHPPHWGTSRRGNLRGRPNAYAGSRPPFNGHWTTHVPPRPTTPRFQRSSTPAVPFSPRAPSSGRYPPHSGCRNCGTGHQFYQHCPASQATCYNCQRKGHWASHCRSIGRSTHEITTDPDATPTYFASPDTQEFHHYSPPAEYPSAPPDTSSLSPSYFPDGAYTGYDHYCSPDYGEF